MTDEVSPLLIETRDATLVMTLNRPEVLNAQNQPMRLALVEALDRLEADDSLRVGILIGAGRAFSAGADLKELASGTVANQDTFVHFERVWACDKPLIAAVHGHAAGGGFELAQLCDVRVATPDARFSQPEVRALGGIAPIAAQQLHHLAGRGEAMLVHLTGRPMSGERAHQVGLVQRLAGSPDELLPVAEALAEEMTECTPAALAKVKQRMRGDVGFRLDGPAGDPARLDPAEEPG